MVQAWSTIRIFVSSTFRDMHAERDYLVKVVFPELRQRCARRRLHLVDLDLRWGVTEAEAEQGKVLEIVLDEIDRSRPFFVAMLGERYGYIPDKVSRDTEFAHKWLRDCQGHSLTDLEIIYSVLRNPEYGKRSFFYFRDPGFIADVPRKRREDYRAENAKCAHKLATLKDRIRASGRPVMENYPCSWDVRNNRVTDLESFGQRVLEDLWTAVCEEYPTEALENDPLSAERQMHETFAEEHASLQVGRTEQAAQLRRCLQDEDGKPSVVTGEPGCGKSAFLAHWYREYTVEHPGDFVLAYFIGASPDSTNRNLLLRNMCQELKRRFDLTEEVPESDDKLSETLMRMLIAATRSKSSVGETASVSSKRSSAFLPGRVVLLLDALDQLLPLEAAQGLGWLLDYIPREVRLVVSSLEGENLDALRRTGAKEISLPPLTVDEQLQIVNSLLKEWGRKLDSGQMASLLAHPSARNPLYLRVALEELKLFGKFEQLNLRINSLAPDSVGLFDQVLDRLEGDHGYELVAETFGLLSCSRYGLSEVELLDLLSSQGAERLPRALWARLILSAKMYLVQRGELFGFFHKQFAEAVRKRYPISHDRHLRLAAYFEGAPDERRIDEYPCQLQHSEQWQALASALCDLEFLVYAWRHNRKYEWMSYWRDLEGLFEPSMCYQDALDARLRLRAKTEGATQLEPNVLDIVGSLLSDMALHAEALSFYKSALKIREAELGPNHPYVATTLSNIATQYESQGRYDEALPLLERSLRIREIALGPNHPDIAITLNNIASVYQDQAEYGKALSFYERALRINETALKPDQTEIAWTLNNIGGVYLSQGSFDKALSFFERSLRTREAALGPNHPDVAITLNNMGGVYENQGKHAEALSFYGRALRIKENVEGPNHPDVAITLNNIARVYIDQGRYREALSLCERALKINETAFGANHAQVATTLNSLATVYQREGRYDEALDFFERTLRISEAVLGPNHPQVATILNNLAMLHQDQGRPEKALSLLERSLKIREAILKPGHPDIAVTLASIAGVYQNQGRYDKALSFYEHSLRISETALGRNHPAVGTTISNMALLYKAQGRYDEALLLYERSLRIIETAFGANHSEVATTLHNIAMVYQAQGKFDEALSFHERSLRISEIAFGTYHPHVATILHNMASLYQAQDRFDEALSFYKRSLRISEIVFGMDRPEVVTTLNNMAMVYHSQGKYDDALPLFERALTILERSKGCDHLDVANNLNYVALTYCGLHEYDKALPLFKHALKIFENTLGSNHPLTKRTRDYLNDCERAR